MTHTAALLLLALGVSSTTVPSWVQKKKASTTMDSIKSVISSIQNSRRLDAHEMGTPECMEACGEDDIKAFGEKLGEVTASGEDTTGAELLTMCDHKPTMVCVSTSEACGPAIGIMGLACLCNCPKVATLGEGDEATKKMCADKPGTVGCMKGENTCQKSVKDANLDDDKALDIGCAYAEKGCTKKMEEAGTCDGMGEYIAASCPENVKDKKDECCPHAEKIVSCLGKDCIELSWALTQKEADKGNSDALKGMEGNYDMASTCSGTGLPTSKAETEAAPAVAAASGSPAAAADFAMPAQSLPVLSMAAAMVAVVA